MNRAKSLAAAERDRQLAFRSHPNRGDVRVASAWPPFQSDSSSSNQRQAPGKGSFSNVPATQFASSGKGGNYYNVPATRQLSVPNVPETSQYSNQYSKGGSNVPATGQQRNWQASNWNTSNWSSSQSVGYNAPAAARSQSATAHTTPAPAYPSSGNHSAPSAGNYRWDSNWNNSSSTWSGRQG